MKKTIAMAVVLLMGQFAFASDDSYAIPTKCLTKLTKFASAFAEANKMFYGSMPAKIAKVTVNPQATLIGESGYADATGSFETVVKDDGEDSTSTTEFEIMFAAEPHCAVMKIQMSGVE